MRASLRPIYTYWHRRRYAFLFVSLLLTIVVAPVMQLLQVRAPLLAAFVSLNLIAAVMGNIGERRFRYLLGFGAIALAMMAAGTFSELRPLLSARDASWIVVVLLATASTLRTVLRRGAVDRERVLAALSVYLLAGITFAVAYVMIDDLMPFSFAEGGRPVPKLVLPNALYFSFVTMATLGYGDIVPVNEVARGVAILEALGGQLYVVVLVARLISLWER